MIVYNVTLKIDHDIHEEWLQWMKAVHIPDVMKTGYFLGNKIFKVMIDEVDGVTYSVQYNCHSLKDLEEYRERYASALQAEHSKKFAGKFVAFRTLLEEM